ncbi:MAG: hypothetical protein JO247_19110 [Chloroflexi bacterium]|nr:hypothetical protein [Chloroflexota bacterium]
MASLGRLTARALGLAAGLCLLAAGTANAAFVLPPNDALDQTPSQVSVVQQPDGSWQYVVSGQPQVFIGMGYDPIYRYLSTEERAANYQRDFQLLQDAGVNTITGWDADKGYEQDKFDELTLSIAAQHNIGVVMPLNLPPGGDYTDPTFVQSLVDEARSKVERFKDYPALRMWGVGNEVFWDMDPDMWPAFEDAYLQIADVFHQLDASHPVIYREAEMAYVPEFADMVRRDGNSRPWLLYGMNVYNKAPGPLLDQWARFGLDRPMLVSEFGTQGDTPEQRATGYAAMWHAIRCGPSYVLGGAPYVWTTAGPEPTDIVWGLMDANSQPVDGTFAALSSAWRGDAPANAGSCNTAAPTPAYVPPSQPIAVPRPPAPAPVVLQQLAPGALTAASPSPSPSPETHHHHVVTPALSSPDPTAVPDPTAAVSPRRQADPVAAPSPAATPRPRRTSAPASPSPSPTLRTASPKPSASVRASAIPSASGTYRRR